MKTKIQAGRIGTVMAADRITVHQAGPRVAQEAARKPAIAILFLASNPRDTEPLALYETVVTAALDELKEQGFDVSQYRDKDGKWTIHADKIDTLMAGEHIRVHRGEEEGSVSEERAEEAA